MTTVYEAERATIANTILEQLGGNKFRVMTGANGFIALDSGLAFKLPSARNANGVKYVRILLDPSDTYTVLFFRGNQTTVAEYSDIYNDQLRGLFEDVTGLRTSLTAIYGARQS